MSNNMINIVLIGYGFVGKIFYVLFICLVLGLNLVFVVFCDEEKVKCDLLDVMVIVFLEVVVQYLDVDLVVIVFFNVMYVLLVCLVLNVGKYVVVDKFFIFDMQEVWELIVLVEEKQCLFFVFYNCCWDSDYFGICQMIE